MLEIDNTQDHFVPRMYLKRFSLPDEPDKVYVFHKQNPWAGVVKRSIRKVERSRDAYTMEADRILTELERTWNNILDFLEGKDIAWLNECLIDRQASAQLRSWLARFVVISVTRSRGLRQRMSDELEVTRLRMIDRLEAHFADFLKKYPDRAKEMKVAAQVLREATNVDSKRKWQAIMLNPLQRGEKGERFYRDYEEGSWRFYAAADGRRFITSDIPSLSLILDGEPPHSNYISFVMPLTDELQLTGWCEDLRSERRLAPTVDTRGEYGMDLANVCAYKNAHQYVYASSKLEIERAVAQFNANPW